MGPPTSRSSLQEAVLEILGQHPKGLSEYELLQHLRERFGEGFNIRHLPPGDLFRVHFRLFHALYHLREELVAAGRGDLRIGPLRIEQIPLTNPSSTLPAQPDPLRAYYLDPEPLTETSDAEVESMVAEFWLRFARSDRRAEALAVLGLEDPVDHTTVRTTYKRLALEHHPDRGGDGQELRRINEAMDELR